MLHTEEGKQMSTKLDRIAKIAKERPKERFTSLMHLINKESLMNEHKEVTGNKATGVDKVSKREYGENLESNIDNLLLRMKRQNYKPLPVRRAYIPKGKDSKRPLGILAYEDKLVQRVTANILNAIYEQDFMECSFGYRPGRNAHDAVALLGKIVNEPHIEYVVDTDIKSFFDNMNHEWLMRFLEHRIADKNLLRLIKRMLIAGVIEDNKKYETTVGAPQGGSISPILANIYLHYAMDLWFEKVVRKQSYGRAYMVRFADDGVFCFEYEEDAIRFYNELIPRLAKFGLEVSEEKTKIVRLNKNDKDGDGNKPTFDFLGFTHYLMQTDKGYTYVTRMTNRKKFAQSLKKVKDWMKINRTLPTREFMNKLKVKLDGYCNYYSVTGNSTRVGNFLEECRKLLYKWLNRRSQRKSFNWTMFNLFLDKYPLPNKRVRVNLNGRKTGLCYLG